MDVAIFGLKSLRWKRYVTDCAHLFALKFLLARAAPGTAP